MSNTPPSFNAPIPEYADFNFLFYRWGYDHLGDNSYKLFRKSVLDYFYSDELIVLIDMNDHAAANFPKQPDVFMGIEDVFLSSEELLELNFTSLIDENKHTPVDLLNIDLTGKAKVIAKDLNGGETLFMDVSFDEEGIAAVGKVETQEELHWIWEDYSRFYFEREIEEVDFSSLLVERNNLKAFEQKTGFFNHGLTDEQVLKFAPNPSEEDKVKRLSSLRKVNEAQKKESQIKRQALERLYPEIIKTHTNIGVTDLRNTLADAVKEETGLNCSAQKFVRNWLEGNNY